MESTPASILIVGSGVFGLSTAFALCKDARFTHCRISLIDRTSFPAVDSASIDTSRIVRSDYADEDYAALAFEAQHHWRGAYGNDDRYHETGFCLSGFQGKDDYLKASLKNVQRLLNGEQIKHGSRDDQTRPSPDPIVILDNPTKLAKATKTGGVSGDWGYINQKSGWVDAEATLRYLRHQLEALDRVDFLIGTVTRLLYSSNSTQIRGAELEHGKVIEADLTILAVGAWTPTLLDMRGMVKATGHVLAYLELSNEEAEYFSQSPVQMNMSTGMFAIPPPPPSQHIPLPGHPRRLYLKIARHSYGYEHEVTIPHPEDPSQPPITVSVPYTHPEHPLAAQEIPYEGESECRAYLQSILSPDSPLRTRPFCLTRICHYADTPTGDFLLDYHPKYNKTLFVATGDSGHAFKFLPVIGEKIVDCILGEGSKRLRQKWRWRDPELGEWKIDGSRGGTKCLNLEEELKREAFEERS